MYTDSAYKGTKFPPFFCIPLKLIQFIIVHNVHHAWEMCDTENKKKGFSFDIFKG